ncbi:MAG: 7-cyano-7-deazaguanine synthase [Candidatus Saccharimonas sp.]
MTDGFKGKEVQKQERTLVMFSGGIDSTATLWFVLNSVEKYGQVHVHHIHIQNAEGRWHAEAQAVSAVLDYMRKYAPAPFTYSESAISTPSFDKKFLYDMEIISFMTGYMTSRDPSITKVILGATGTDYAMGSTRAVAQSKASHNAFHPDVDDHSGKVKEFPLKDLTKQQVYDTLPLELARLTWSCRRPVRVNGKFVECGICKTCTQELRGIIRTALPTGGAV